MPSEQKYCCLLNVINQFYQLSAILCESENRQSLRFPRIQASLQSFKASFKHNTVFGVAIPLIERRLEVSFCGSICMSIFFCGKCLHTEACLAINRPETIKLTCGSAPSTGCPAIASLKDGATASLRYFSLARIRLVADSGARALDSGF